MCSWYRATDWHPIHGVFQPHNQFSEDRLQIFCYPDPDKAVTESVWLSDSQKVSKKMNKRNLNATGF